MKRLLIAILLLTAVQGKAAVFGDSANADVDAQIPDTTTFVKKSANPVAGGSMGVLDSAIVKFSPAWQAGDKQWAVVYLNTAGKPGTMVAKSTDYATTVSNGVNIVETYTVHFAGETFVGGDSLWIGGFVQPMGTNGAKWASTDSTTAFAMYGIGWHWREAYSTSDVSAQLEPPGNSFDWTTYAYHFTTNANNIPWIKIYYHVAGAHTPNIHLIPPVPSSGLMSFSATAGGADPAAQNLIIADSGAGTGVMSWTLTKDSSWMTVTPMSGSVYDTVAVSVALAGRPAGTYKDTIVVTCAEADNTPESLAVVLTVNAVDVPIIATDPDSLGFTVAAGGTNPAAQTIEITNIGSGTMPWYITHSESWLLPTAAADSSGTGADTISWHIVVGANTIGVYYDTLWVTCATASNTPQPVEVIMNVTQPARHVMVRRNP